MLNTLNSIIKNLTYFLQNDFHKTVSYILDQVASILEKLLYIFVVWYVYECYPDICNRTELYVEWIKMFLGAWIPMIFVFSDYRRESLALKKITLAESTKNVTLFNKYDLIWFILFMIVLFLFF